MLLKGGFYKKKTSFNLYIVLIESADSIRVQMIIKSGLKHSSYDIHRPFNCTFVILLPLGMAYKDSNDKHKIN